MQINQENDQTLILMSLPYCQKGFGNIDRKFDLCTYLTPDGAEPEFIKERARADLTEIRRSSSFTSSGPDPFRLGPLIQKKHLRTVYDISVHPLHINQPLHLRHTHHLMVRWSPNLHVHHKYIHTQKEKRKRKKRKIYNAVERIKL